MAAARLRCCSPALALGASTPRPTGARLAKLPARSPMDRSPGTLPGSATGPKGRSKAPAAWRSRPAADLYVSDYYHRAVDVFTSAGTTRDPVPRRRRSAARTDQRTRRRLRPRGRLCRQPLRQRIPPGACCACRAKRSIDPGQSTGVAVDAAGNVYVDDRTYVAVYERRSHPARRRSQKIGVGNLVDAYGVAVDSGSRPRLRPRCRQRHGQGLRTGGRARRTRSERSTGRAGARFSSLVDASVAVDESATEGKGHLLVVDDLEPGAEIPQAAIYEFDSARHLPRPAAERGASGRRRSTDRADLRRTLRHRGRSRNAATSTSPPATANRRTCVKYGPFEPFAPAAPPGGASRRTPPTAAVRRGQASPPPARARPRAAVPPPRWSYSARGCGSVSTAS